jgi:hypothetical protein
MLNEIIKEYFKLYLYKYISFISRFIKKTIQLIKVHNTNFIYITLHFSINITYLVILNGYSLLVNEKLNIFNSLSSRIYI